MAVTAKRCPTDVAFVRAFAVTANCCALLMLFCWRCSSLFVGEIVVNNYYFCVASASFGAGFELVNHTTDDSVHSSAVRRGSDWFSKVAVLPKILKHFRGDLKAVFFSNRKNSARFPNNLNSKSRTLAIFLAALPSNNQFS